MTMDHGYIKTGPTGAHVALARTTPVPGSTKSFNSPMTWPATLIRWLALALIASPQILEW